MTLKATKVDNFEAPGGTDKGEAGLIDAVIENGFDPSQKCQPINIDISGTVGVSIRHLLGYPYAHCCDMFLGIVTLLAGSLAVFATPGLIGVVVDAMSKPDDEKWEDINFYCIWMGIICFISAVACGIRGYTFNKISESIANMLRYDLFLQLINKDIAFFDETKTGEILSRISSDTGVIQDGLSTNISMFVRSFIVIVATLIICCIISPTLTAITLGGIIPIVVFAVYYSFKVRILAKATQDEKAVLGNIAEETIGNIRTVKAFSNERLEGVAYRKTNEKVFQLGKAQAYWAGLFSCFSGISMNGAIALVIYRGSIEVEQGIITIGAISAFLLYMIQLVMNFAVISMVIGNVYKVIGASAKIITMMQKIPIISTRGGKIIAADSVKGEIEFKNVNFCYPTKPDVQVAKNISIKINQNEIVALVGKSGCGKSSMISLINRFYDPADGEILFSGHNIKELEPRWYHSQIAIVQQEPVLFSGTIKENICYGLDIEKVTDEMLDEACDKANALSFVKDKKVMPEGYDTIVGERGVKLSGGQKQRVAIARALIRKPKLLLLDEATSALDAESEHHVQIAIDKLIKEGGQTVIVIAHRLSTIRDANKIVVLQQGEVVETGTHEDLVRKDGIYKKLIQRQLTSQQSPTKLNEQSPTKAAESTPANIAETADKRQEAQIDTNLAIQESTIGNFDVPDEGGENKNFVTETKQKANVYPELPEPKADD